MASGSHIQKLFITFASLSKQANMNRQGTLIVVDDNKNILTSLHYLLNSYFDQIVTLSSPVALPTTIQQKRPDVILLDMNF